MIFYLLWINKTWNQLLVFKLGYLSLSKWQENFGINRIGSCIISSMEYIDNFHQSSVKWVCQNEICIIKYWYSSNDSKRKKNKKNDAIVGFWCIKYLNNTLKFEKIVNFLYTENLIESIAFTISHFILPNERYDTIWLNRTHRKIYWSAIVSRILWCVI